MSCAYKYILNVNSETYTPWKRQVIYFKMSLMDYSQLPSFLNGKEAMGHGIYIQAEQVMEEYNATSISVVIYTTLTLR